MDFNEAYFRLYLAEGFDNQGNDNTKLNDHIRNKQIKRNYLVQKEAERIKNEIEKKAKRDKEEHKKRLKYRTMLNTLSTK